MNASAASAPLWKPVTGQRSTASSLKLRRCAMLWEVEIRPKGQDGERGRVAEEFNLLTYSDEGERLVTASARGYLLEGILDRAHAMCLMSDLLVDALVATGVLGELRSASTGALEPSVTVLLKPGVMD